MKRHARERDARDVGQVGEGRLQDQSVKWMAADDLGRDRAAEGVAVEDRGDVLRPDLIVQPRRRYAVIDDAGERRRSAAASESAVVEEEDVNAGVEEIRHDVGGVRKVAGVSVAVDRRGDWMLRAAIPSVKQFTVVRFEGQD